MSHRVTLVCDTCGKEYIVDEVMDMPPYWFVVTVSVADRDGFVPESDGEKEDYLHFCCQDCFADYASGQEVKEMLLLIDKTSKDNQQGNSPEGDDDD